MKRSWILAPGVALAVWLAGGDAGAQNTFGQSSVTGKPLG